jgi:hypothetical protein
MLPPWNTITTVDGSQSLDGKSRDIKNSRVRKVGAGESVGVDVAVGKAVGFTEGTPDGEGLGESVGVNRVGGDDGLPVFEGAGLGGGLLSKSTPVNLGEKASKAKSRNILRRLRLESASIRLPFTSDTLTSASTWYSTVAPE